MAAFRRIRCLALALSIVLAPFASFAPARADRVVTGAATMWADNWRTNNWPDPGPQGNVGIEANVTLTGSLMSMIFVDGLAFGSVSQDNSATVGAWDAATGEQVWTVSNESDATFFVSSGIAYAAFADGTVMALDAATGKPKWQARSLPQDAHADRAYILVADGTVYVATGGYASAFDASDGTRRWAKKVQGGSDAEDSNADIIFLTLANGSLVIMNYGPLGYETLALDVVTGASLWTSREIAAASADGQHLFGVSAIDSSNRLMSVDAATGLPRWRSQATAFVSYPAISDVGSLYAVNRVDYAGVLHLGFLQAMETAGGAPTWRAPLRAGWGDAAITPVLAGGRVIVAQESGVSAFDAVTGALAWQVATPCAELRSILGVADGRIYVATNTGWIVLGGDAGPNKTAIHQASGWPVSAGNPATLTADATLVDTPSANGFPVDTLKSGDQLMVTGESVSAEGKTWWPVSTNGDNGYLPDDVLAGTGCPSS